MPGKYLEYIRAGRYVVPVELTFVPITYKELLTGKEVTTSKWVERRHWKEIKALLKPALESVIKYNESITEKISKSSHIQFGHETAFGYIIHINKEKSPFLAVLDSKKNFWTDDEEEEVDENTNICDFGGRHKSFTPTKCYIKACVSKKSDSETEDRKKLRKELGVKSDDVRNYFQSSNSATGVLPEQNYPGSSLTGSHEKSRTKSSSKKKDKSRRKDRNEEHHNRQKSGDEFSSSESLIDLPPPKSHACGTNERRNLKDHETHRQTAVVGPEDSTTSVSAEKKDDDDLEITESVHAVGRGFTFGESHSTDETFRTSFFRNYLDEEEDDDDEELPELPDIVDIDSFVPQKGRRGKKGGGGSRKKSMSPTKHNHSGLPDIDDGIKCTKGSKAKKKRNVAIVEPMKPVRASSGGQISFEEAIGAFNLISTERKRKGRNTSSPTIDRLLSGSRSKNSNSAIEILGEDSDLLSIDTLRSQTAADKRKRKEAGEKSPRKPRRVNKKRIEASRYERLTPSPFPESPDESEQNQQSQNESSDSEPEMPVLVKMVSTSDEEEAQTVVEIVPEINISSSITVPPLEREVTIDASGQETEQQQYNVDSERLDLQIPSNTTINEKIVKSVTFFSNKSSPFSKKKKSKKRSSLKSFKERSINSLESNSENNLNNFQQSRNIFSAPSNKRTRPASDSDDITAESAYRKKPLKRRKRRKIHIVSESSKETTASVQVAFQENEASNTISLQQRKSTDDAQTQTVFNTTVTMSNPGDSSENIHENQDENITKKSVTKTERLDDSTAYDSDYANGAFSDGEDDDVLFDGQFQANLHMPALGSSEDDVEELELFSFDRPAAVVINKSETALVNSSSISSQPIAPVDSQLTVNIDDNEDGNDYSFDLATATINRTSTDRPQCDPRILRSLQNDSDHSYHNSDSEEYEHESVENLSTFQLMKYPGTLQAGCGLLSQVITNTLNTDEVFHRLGHKGKSKEKKKRKDKDLMPPPPQTNKRPVSPDICSLNPEEQLRKQRPKRLIRQQSQDQLQFSHRSDSPQPGPSSGIRFNQSHPVRNIDDMDDSGDELMSSTTGEPFLRELMSRTRQPEPYVPQGDEFDLSQRSHCMLDVITDYAEKSRLYKKHVKNIKHLTVQQLKKHFETIKPNIQGVFEGSIDSRRNRLYCSKYQQDRQTLRNMNWLRPFKGEHGSVLSTWLYDFLLPQPGSRLKYTDYINFVMLPEAFIRIFSIVNNVSYETAEKEMRAGPCYEGPYMDS